MESIKSSYHFGSYYLNEREGVLLRDGSPVALTPKAFDTLLVLVRNSGHLVEKDELMRQVWPETAVEESNLTQNIFMLRKILGESNEESKYIETVPRRGYRFVAAVREISEPVSFLTKSGEGGIRASDRSQLQGFGYLAVLPFVNSSGDANMEYLSDGITEGIINSLSQLPVLRVMSRSTVFRYKGGDLDAQRIGRELGVSAVLVGRVHSQDRGLLISTELVDVANGWQIWGAAYDRDSDAILEVQNEIASQISAALRLKLTGEEERRLSKRFTESPPAYQAYLEGRHYWSKYTREGLEQAIACFREAIDLDPTYVLAYAGIVDCYLRLATNYLPPEDVLPHTTVPTRAAVDNSVGEHETPPESINLRYEWDQKAVERELRRASEMKFEYPSAHQWHAAYQFALNLFQQSQAGTTLAKRPNFQISGPLVLAFEAKLARQFQSSSPTRAEEIQIHCAVAREQIDSGNYEAACAMLQRWWTFGEWPKLEGLGPDSSADLLYTAGALAGCVASTRQVPRGQKHAEALLNGSIALFEQLGSKSRAAEGRIELGTCYYREGLFDLARATLLTVLEVLPTNELEIRGLTLWRLGVVGEHSGRLHDAFSQLSALGEIVALIGPPFTGRYHLELASTLKELAIAERHDHYFDRSLEHFAKALYEFEAIGNHRFAAIVENNHGHLLLSLERYQEAEVHLERAWRLFDRLADKVRNAQVAETLAQLYIAIEQLDLAEQSISRSVEVLRTGGEEAVLAESLTTQGLILCRQGRHYEAKRVLNRAYEVAERCGDTEGAGRSLLIMIEEMCEQLDDLERQEMARLLSNLLANSQSASIRARLQECLRHIMEAHRF